MGTVVTIDVFGVGGPDVRALDAHLDAALAELRDADRVFSTWQPDSAMSRVRRGELALVEAPQVVTEVLGACALARRLSGGWFDPWALPGGVDPTGYVKGWAAQRVAGTIAATGVTGVLVNAAGDVASVGGMENGAPFRIGIADPASKRELACVVELRGAIATSGAYERGPHLIDPWIGRPAARVASASVVGPDLGLADALATGLAVGGDDVLALIEDLDEYQALTIGADGARSWTVGFPFAASP